MRISSTQISMFCDCPRKWALAHVAGHPAPAGKAAAVGSIFHAIQEWRVYHDEGGDAMPSFEAIYAWPGNYDSPAQAFDRFGADELWVPAVRMAEGAGAPNKYLPDESAFPHLFVEYDLDAHAVPVVPGIEAGGYLDILLLDDLDAPTAAWIGDWKTRGAKSMAEAPSGEQFETNRQLAYYAAVLSRVFPTIETVTVNHINVLRPETKKAVVTVNTAGWSFHRERLDEEWAWLTDEIAPAMLAAKAAFEAGDEPSVSTNPAVCFQFGRCPLMGQCREIEARGALARKMSGGSYNPFG